MTNDHVVRHNEDLIVEKEFDMENSFALGLALTCGTFALMAGVPNTAHAVNANHSGTICKNYNAAEATDIDYLTNGVRNLNASSRSVICPIVGAPQTSSGGSRSVHIDGFASTGYTINCTLYSFNSKGLFVGSKSFSTPATGTFDIKLSVSAGTNGALSVLCLLPPSANGVLYDVDVTQ